jgi:thiol-disulfide isomerase/thioredoxin
MTTARALAALLALPLAAACNPSAKITEDAPTTPTSAASAPPITTATALPPASGSTVRPSASAEAPRENGVRMISASPDSDALSLVRTERLRAKAEGRVLVVYAGATWCEPCRRFKEEVHAGRLDETLPKITLLAFDADRDTERLGSAGYRFQFIPYVALAGADGRPIETQEARGKGSGAWRELVGKLSIWQQAK